MDATARVQPSRAASDPEKTRELLVQARAGDEGARERLVEENLRLVASIVARFRPTAAEYDDLFQVGCIGLLKAIDRFDPEYGVRLSTYAVPLIMGEIRQYTRSARPLRIGRTLHDLSGRVARTRESLTQELGRGPTVLEIAEALAVDAEDVVMALEASAPVASLDSPIAQGDADGAVLADVVAGVPRFHEEVANVDNVVLKEALTRLAPWERRLIGLRFFADKSQTEVARLLGVSQAHVSRTEQRLLQTFRHFFDS